MRLPPRARPTARGGRAVNITRVSISPVRRHAAAVASRHLHPILLVASSPKAHEMSAALTRPVIVRATAAAERVVKRAAALSGC